MNNNFIEFENSQKFTDKDIFTKIWTSPRKIFKYINDNNYNKYVNILLFFAGISRAFDRASSKNMGDEMSLLTILAICIIAGGLLGWISYYLYAALLSWTGKWINGQADTKSILRIISYALTPSVIALVFLTPQIGIYGNEIFKSDGDLFSAGLIENFLVYGSLILELILGVWTIVFCVVGISEVQKLSIGKAILNLLLPFLVFAIPIIVIIFISKAL
jgi:hypothetical protein